MIPLALLILGLAIVTIGSVADLRWREVPDWSNYFGISAALMIRTIYSLGTGSWGYVFEGLLGLGAMYCLACGLFYLGQWGGGDSKLLMALGAIFGLGFSPDSTGGLMGSFLVNLILFGGIWGGFWSVKLAIEHQTEVSKAYKSLMRKKAVLHAKMYFFVIALGLLALAFAFPITSPAGSYQFRIPLIILAATGLLTFYTWGFAKSVEKACFIKNVPVKNLEEGDWIQHDILVKGKRLAGPSDLGVSRDQIKALNLSGLKTVTVKEGVPFVPGFFLAYAATILVGNGFMAIVSAIGG